MVFLFVRHGLTEETSKGLKGKASHDNKLSSEGVQQAKRAAKICAEYNPSKVYSSPYIRAKETAKIIADGSNSELIVAEELKEYQVGEWGDLPLEQGRQKFIEAGMWNYNDKKYEFKPPGGESWKEVHQRTHSLLEEVEKISNNNETIVFVSHNAAMKAMTGYLQGKDLKDWLPMMFDTGSVSGFRKTKDKWSELFINKTRIS